MTFSMSQAEAPKTRYNREKLGLGRHVCKVLNVREHNGFQGNGFFIDFEVVSGPSGEGAQSSFMVYPDKARGSAKMTDTQARAKELGKIQVALAACYGHDAKGASTVNDAVYQASIAQPSPVAGRLITVDCKPHTNKKGEQTSYYELLPHLVEGQPTAAPVAAKSPPLPAKKEGPAFPPIGWAVHPEDPTYFYNAETEEVMSEDDLRAAVA